MPERAVLHQKSGHVHSIYTPAASRPVPVEPVYLADGGTSRYSKPRRRTQTGTAIHRLNPSRQALSFREMPYSRSMSDRVQPDVTPLAGARRSDRNQYLRQTEIRETERVKLECYPQTLFRNQWLRRL